MFRKNDASESRGAHGWRRFARSTSSCRFSNDARCPRSLREPDRGASGWGNKSVSPGIHQYQQFEILIQTPNDFAGCGVGAPVSILRAGKRRRLP
jgi:hypothetical protein